MIRKGFGLIESKFIGPPYQKRSEGEIKKKTAGC
jgi:hypothetical protein